VVNVSKSQLVGLGVFVILLGVTFAAYTQHVWEDYYITFRSSQNLAEGNGLVYNVGERVHTFTSPLGVLLPALAAWISGPENVAAALWIYRVVSLIALACACVFLVGAARQMQLAMIPAMLAGAWLALDAKTLDFSINGMETGLWVAFLGYAIWAQLGGAKMWKHLGLAWAGLMWTRPDCFIHISLLAIGSLLFLAGRHGQSRVTMIAGWFKAAALTTALYLPWFVGAWVYYGSPVPHTVAAKGGLGVEASLWEQVQMVAMLPIDFTDPDNSMLATFLPAYHQLGGWNEGLIIAGKILGSIAGLAWLLPRISAPVRWLSFVYFGIHIYLTLVPYFAFPWYLPAAAPFGVLVLVGLARDLAAGSPAGPKHRRQRWQIWPVGVGLILSAGLTWQVALQMRAQQRIIEDENRTRLGQFIGEHAGPGDTVFTEPLGYVGFFSGLKTYDFPGMSSPEMVAAREAVGESWRDLLDYLQPDWVVLRPQEVARIEHGSGWRMVHAYDRVAEFDQSAAVAASMAPGLGYLKHDAVFWLYRRTARHAVEFPGWVGDADTPIIFHQRPWGGRIDIESDGELVFDIPADATKANLQLGLFAQPAEFHATTADGIRFGAEVRDSTRITPLRTFFVNPTAEDQLIPMSLELPTERSENAKLRLIISRGIHRDFDRAYFFLPDFATD
jgi:hypothetical protein